MKEVFVATFAASVLACALGLPSSVVRFDVEPEVPRRGRLGSFKFINCLPASKEEAVINSLVLKPDPIVFPGPLDVSFDASVKETLGAPLKGVVYMGKKVGSVFIKIPCIGMIGSCTYDDVCQLLSQITQCPDPLVAAGIPCQCPFKAGSYKLPDASFDVESAVFPPGDYHVQANLTMNSQVVGCYDIMATFG